MKYARFGCLLLGSLLLAYGQDPDPSASPNVNSRYTVETVILSGKGWTTNLQSESTDKISTGLRHQLVALIGQKLDPKTLDNLAVNLKKELNAREVTHRIERGEIAGQVRVEFDVKPVRSSVGLSLDSFTYDSKIGWSGSGEATVTASQNTFGFGLASDGDGELERYAGIRASYENKHLGTERVGLKFLFDSYHDQWNRNTLIGLEGHPATTSDAYRSRQTFQPTLTVQLSRPLTLEVGTRFERYTNENPQLGNDGSDGIMASLRYHRQLEGSDIQQDFDGALSLLSTTRLLDSDFVFNKWSAGLRYQFRRAKHQVIDNIWGGTIDGRAPLNERFVMGNTAYLRGWNKYDIDPLGGNRVIHNSVEYRYGCFQLFYDAGAIWDEGQPAIPRHSLGIGVHDSIFSLAVAFPVKSGHVEPILMMGIIP
jgi:hypothetical protein